MIFQHVCGIIGRTHDFHIHLLKQLKRAFFRTGKRGIDFVPKLFAAFGSDQGVFESQTAADIQMNPFIHRVAGDFRKYGNQFQPFFLWIGFAGNVFFGNAAFTHHFPDIMVCGGNHLPGGFIIVVDCDFRNVGMVVSINNGQSLHFAEKCGGGVIAEQIAFIKKSHDTFFLFYG